MLTSDLVQVRMNRGQVVPRYIDGDDPAHRELAASLVAIFERHVGRPRGELTEELEELLGTGTEFLLHRGLAKLLFDRCRFDTYSRLDPPTLRQAVFAAAAAVYRGADSGSAEPSAAERAGGLGEDPAYPLDRPALVTRLCRELGLEEAHFEHNLYADLKDQQILVEFPPLAPDRLLLRYNCALAQAVLYKAQELKITISGQSPVQYRALLRKIKFFQLLHRVEGDARRGYTIHLDGPLSLFKASQKYGLQMASFLPTLLHFQGWTLTASLLWGKKRRQARFRLTPEVGLKSHTRLTGQWQPEEIAWLPRELDKLDSPWQVVTDAELVELGGQGVLVPDYVFYHPPTGRRVFFEVFGFWNRGAVDSRLRLLRRHGPKNLILALSKSLKVDEEALAELPAEVYVFRSAPVARKVLKILERFESTEVG